MLFKVCNNAALTRYLEWGYLGRDFFVYLWAKLDEMFTVCNIEKEYTFVLYIFSPFLSFFGDRKTCVKHAFYKKYSSHSFYARTKAKTVLESSHYSY